MALRLFLAVQAGLHFAPPHPPVGDGSPLRWRSAAIPPRQAEVFGRTDDRKTEFVEGGTLCGVWTAVGRAYAALSHAPSCPTPPKTCDRVSTLGLMTFTLQRRAR